MRPNVLAATAAVAALTMTSCATTTCPQCRPLPSSGTYGVCAVDAEGSKHVQVGDKVLIGRIGNVTKVAFGPPAEPRKTLLKMFQGEQGLVGWGAKGDSHDDHVVVIETVKPPRNSKGCTEDNVISIQFVEPDTDGKYRGSRSGPHYGHAHAQIESLTVPTL